MRVLVTDSDSRAALAATRSLGRAGHEVIVAGTRHPSLAAASRHAAAFELYPSPAAEADGFVTAIVEIATRRAVDVVLPMTEVTTLLLAEHAQRLPASCKLPFAARDTIANASNKAHVVALAQELGVPAPRTAVVESAQECRRAVDGFSYPIVIKPARSRVRSGARWLSTGVSYAADAAELERSLAALPREVFPVLLQERIVGAGAGVFACYDHGRPVAFFAHRRLREKPPSGGVSVLCESAPLDPLAVRYSRLLLERLGWHGVAMVEFKRDNHDGQLKIMEINGRFWGSLQLAIDAGVDFPALLVDIATGRSPCEPGPYRLGARSRWLAGDLDALLAVLFLKRDRLNLPPNHPGRWRSLRDFLRRGEGDQRLEMERRDDPGPARLEWRRWLFR